MVFVVPFLVFLVVIFVLPVALIVYTSLVHEQTGVVTLEFFRTFFYEGLYLRVLWNTIEVSAVGTAATLVFGYPVAYYLAKQPPQRRLLLSMFVLLPFYTSILVKSFAFSVILGHAGIVNWLARLVMGPDFAFKLLFNRTGVIIGIVHDQIPFAVFPILVNLLAQNPALHRAAEVMGAGRLRIFWQVVFPLSLPAVVASVLLVVVRVMGQFVTPALLGGRREMMMANLIDFHVKQVLDWNMAAAISIVLLVMSSAFLIALARLRGAQLFGERA